MIRVVLIVVLLMLLLGAAPVWPYSHEWGYYPSGSLVLLIVIVALLFGRRT